MRLDTIFFVLVLYKESLEQSKSIVTLNDFIPKGTTLFVYDNSPENQYGKEEFLYKNFKVNYFHDPLNKGISSAYNYALTQAKDKGFFWMLLLDQDTTFTEEYINSIKGLDLNSEVQNNTVAIIPTVKDLSSQRLISPSKSYKGGFIRPIHISAGLIKKAITGINSGTILSISYLKEISGFYTSYSLDMLDHWYFRKIFKDSKTIYLLDCTIFQDLSIFGKFEDNVSEERYKQMVSAEKRLIKEEGVVAMFFFKIRMFLRSLKQLSFKNKNYFKITLRALV